MDFAQRLITWQRRHGRHDLPWQNTRDPYRVWLSEIMLQQTQVATVIPYYLRFLERFPDLAVLAAAPLESVLEAWAGLGYYARARNLHACARQVAENFDGVFPQRAANLANLPGIGRSTANAIATACFAASEPILDGNVKRVFCRHFGIEGFPGTASVECSLWSLAAEHMPRIDGASYNQALMDLGATRCTRRRPHCETCPLELTCVARREGRQDELPTPRPARVLPLRATRFLMLSNAAGELLLERRPPAGIWGGLWCPPELPDAVEAEEWCRATLGMVPGPVLPAPSFLHAFTHFRLTLLPLDAQVLGGLVVAEGQWRWWLPAEARQAAVPTPVRRLLDEWASRHGESQSEAKVRGIVR